MTQKMLALGAVILLTMPSATLAHVSLKTEEAPAGSNYEAMLNIAHGCEGSPTVTVRVQIPPGVVAVKPMPKPGWQLETKVEAYPEPVQVADETIVEGVREIIWSGGNLPDDWYDVFVFRGRLPHAEPGTVIHFPVVQECVEAVHRWIESPTDGGGDSPAPAVTISSGEAPDQ